MEFPEEQYYRLNQIFLLLIGLWPYDSNINRIQVTLSLLIYISCIAAQLIKLFITEYNLDILLKILSFIFLIMIWVIKYITFYAVINNIKEFRKRMRSNWSIVIDNREIDIMHKYANFGRLFTVILAMCVYLGAFIFILMQYMPNLLDIVLPLNETRPRELAMEHFIDQQKYFHILAIHINIGMFVLATTGIATESFSLINAFHVFGMFKIASYRVEHMLSDKNLRICMDKKYIILHNKLVAAVDAHRRAIELSELLKTNFGIPYLFVIVTSICSASINLFHLFWLITTKHENMEIIKSFLLTFFHFVFLIAGNFAGQEFINRDDHVHRVLCNTQWHSAPLKIQKLILFLLQKTTKSYKLDAGGMFSPCLEGLTAAMSLMFSFFMVLCSVQ